MTRVVIADDHPLMLSGIEAVLRGTAYDVVAKVRDGAAALDAVETMDPDILILDVKMPEQSGIDVLRILRTRGDRRAVVLLTANLDDEALMEGIELDANGIVLKDGAETLILSCLDKVSAGERWIERSILQRALDIARHGNAEPQGPIAQLSARERSIALLVSRGLRNKEIGRELGMSEGTVKIYLHRIYDKLDVQNRVELAMLCRDEAKD
jgi:two-component system nitrate/nitrite response regulator NarL